MRQFLLLGVLCALCSPALLPREIPLQDYAARRAELRKNLDGTLGVFGNTEGPDDLYGFIQEPNFYYLTGWSEPGALLVLTRSSEQLFLPHHNEHMEHYGGRKVSAEDADAKQKTGFADVLPIERFEGELTRALGSGPKVYALKNQEQTAKLASFLQFRAISDAAPVIAKLREKKSPAEIEAIQHATDVSVEAHRAAWKR